MIIANCKVNTGQLMSFAKVMELVLGRSSRVGEALASRNKGD